MKEKGDEKEELISTDSDAHGTEYIGSVTSSNKSGITNVVPFNITPQELTNIVNKYKERDENMQDINYFKEKGGINFLLEAVMTDKSKGISSLEGREAYFGSNKIFRKPPPSFWDFVIEALSDKMIIILIFCSIFEIGISLYYIFGGNQKDNIDWIDGTSIIIAVLVVVSVGSITNYKKEMKFQDLNNIQNGTTKYNVIRNGIPQLIISDELLVGDLIKINYGEILPADMLLIEGDGIKIDESALTGESRAVKKNTYEICLEEMNNGGDNVSSNILLSGTNVIEGTGTCVAIAIGEHSQKGIIRGTIDNASEDNKTPLENKLNVIADLIGYFGLGSAVVTLIALVIQMIVRYSTGDEEFSASGLIKNIITIIILCVSIIVVAIPEGLPLAVTLSLSFSIKKLMDNNNLVRKMHACETMGGANVICTDKTGTLTMNVMLVRRLITHSERIEINPTADLENLGLAKKETRDEHKKKKREEHQGIFPNEEYWDAIYNCIALNVDSTIIKLNEPDLSGDTEICETKNKTDKGFIEFLYQYKSPISVKKELFLSNKDFYKISPFDSQKKRMTTYVKSDKFPTGYRLFTKGGAENALLYCNRYINKNTGKVENLTEEIKEFINNEINEMNKKMMRTLYICYNDITEQEYDNIEKPDKSGLLPDQKQLIFVGIFGLQDSLRPGVRNAVDECHMAGVRVIMVTGDNLITATSIAKDCHIFPAKIDVDKLRLHDVETNPSETSDPEKSPRHIQELLDIRPYAMTGNSFYNAIEGIYCQICGEDTLTCKCPKSEAEAEELAKDGSPKKPVKIDAIRNMDNFTKITANLLVMARSQPLHKYALVLGLRSLGNVVAVTGDGTNDAPALSKSDVGFSMNDGTDIAKEASDIILMDNNFTSIVAAIIYGRSIYENLRKFLQFQLTVNFGACILVFLCSCIGNETPLTSIQMLWVNLIMDSLGSLALATEPPYQELLRKKPTNRNESIINGKMWKHIGGQSLFEIAILLMLYLIAPSFIPEDKDTIHETAKYIEKCFGKLPGGYTDKDKILSGNRDKWVSDKNFNISDSSCLMICNEKDESILESWDNITMEEFYDRYVSHYGGTTHMTFIFDVFVVYTLFNQINCRMIDDSFNTFKRINKGIMFCIVTLCELVIQIILSQVGRQVFHCVIDGLSFAQWGICLGLSISTMLFNFILKLIPLDKCIDKYTKPDPSTQQQNADYSRTTVRNIVNRDLKE